MCGLNGQDPWASAFSSDFNDISRENVEKNLQQETERVEESKVVSPATQF